MRKNKGITLIALVITIIILLILAGVTIATLKESGLFEKAKLAKEKSDEAKNNENSILLEYENQISQQINKKTIKSMKEMLKNCQLNENYTEEQILNNEDNILTIIYENSDSVDYLIKNKIDDICNSETAMSLLGKSTVAYEKVMSNEEFFNKIISSTYINEFEESANKVPKLTSNSDQGYILNGIAADGIGMSLYNAFDYTKTTSWLDTYWPDNVYGDGIITIEFPKASKVYHMYYFLESTWTLNYNPISYKIYGINNNEEILLTQGELGISEKDIYFYNNVNYKKYKLEFEKGNQGSAASIIGLYYR